jgi:hypothetical protein
MADRMIEGNIRCDGRIGKRVALSLFLALGVLFSASIAHAATTYVSQSGGTFSGGSACNGKTTVSVATFNGQSPSPGDTIYFCGSITSAVQVKASGTAGNVIAYIADTGASIQIQGTLNTCPIVVNNHNYLLFDGGGAGGTNGILAVLNNGSNLAALNLVSAFCSEGNSTNVEVRNWKLGPIYQHTDPADHRSNADIETNIWFSTNTAGGTVSIHDNVMYGVGVAILIEGTLNSSPTFNIYNNYVYNMDWALGFAPPAGAYTLNFHDNHIGSTKNWDTSNDMYHHDGIHFFTGAGPSSIATNIYNNLFDGDWGTCCSTAFIFQESSIIANLYIYNNVFTQLSGNLMPLVQVGGTTGAVYDNTFQCGSGGYNNEGLQIYNTSTNFSVKNNAFQGCNTFIQWGSSTLGTGWVVDYNVYMNHGAGGNNAWWGTNTFSTWASSCSCDSHSTYSATNSLNSDGTPTSSFPGLAAGAHPGMNLTPIGLTAITSDTSAGNTRTPTTRGLVPNLWTVGAYNVGSGSTTVIQPPSGLTATVN